MIKKFIACFLMIAILLLCACGEAEEHETETMTGTQDSSLMTSENESITNPDEQQPSDEDTHAATNAQNSTQNNNETNTDEQQPSEEIHQSTSEQESQTPTTTEPIKIYEDHLAALTIFALSMEYPDFILEGIYSATSVALEKKESSAGIYAVFESFGETITVHVYPIEQERTEAMTRDLYASELGFAAFDEVDVCPDGVKKLDEDVFAALLNALSGVSIYSH